MTLNPTLLQLPILLPVIGGVVVLALRKAGVLRDFTAILFAVANLVACALMLNQNVTYCVFHDWAGNWNGMRFEFALKLTPFSGFMVACVGVFGMLVAMFSFNSLRGKSYAGQFYAYMLLTLGAASGAVMADNFVALLFFWEGLLITVFAMIAIGNPDAWKTATKTFIILGITDLCLMFGLGLTALVANGEIARQIAAAKASGASTDVLANLAKLNPLSISDVSGLGLPITGLTGLAFVMILIGAISKAGAMPFHTWIPDAATDAPLPFMALLIGSLDKLVGIYFLTRVSLDLFKLNPQSWVSTLMMTIGAVTILGAVMMALVQKEYKRLLSFHAISQVGYMILGIGTMVPAGIVGGLFHMLNNAMYKNCLFLTAGSVEKQAGTTALEKLGGLGRKMPVTFACFFVTALSISGVPPFNGFFSKELVYDGALERGTLFYLAAVLGSFFTAASFLKLGHAAFLGPRRPENDGVKESPLIMLVPMFVIAAGCLLFGVFNAMPIHYLEPGLTGSAFFAARGEELARHMHHLAGWPADPLMVGATVLVLAAAVINHLIGVRLYGSGLHAVDHIHYAPFLHGMYERAERRWFDPYNWGMKLVDVIAKAGYGVDRAIDWVYDKLTVTVTLTLTTSVRLAHTGSYALYIVWALAGAIAIVVVYMMN